MENPTTPKKLAGRYEVRQILGQGGMGLVYRAYDTVIRREVAVKTILDLPDPSSLQLFYKECDVLASMSHPNIVEIFDIGEFEEEGKKKPYFVMPLLPGTTLDSFIRKASHRLTVERAVEIITQTCRGLHAAHEHGLIHRDLKPSNIFVMEDDSVKIIDFGVAHMTDAHTTRAQKGTLLYMSPEQIELKPLTPASDLFSLSVVCYEALTAHHPFQRARADEVVDAILRQIPPPASELNSAISQSISRVIHKGMAKQSWHRFATAREFSDTLSKALRNEPIEFFDPQRLAPRLQRASKALESGDLQFAGEILGELEAEGHMDTGIGSLRRQLDSVTRRKTLTQLLDGAKARFEEEEDPLALQKLHEVLQLEPDNAAALSLKTRIESRRSERQIDSWYKLAKQHIDNHAYPHAREALQNVVQLRPQEARALQLIAEVDRQEQEYNKLRQEKEQIHRAALDAWHKGDVSNALAKLGLVLELDRRAPESAQRQSSTGTNYQSFYNEVRSEHDAMNTAYAEARKHLAERNFAKALGVCQAYLTKYPTNAIFQALRYDIEEQKRQELSSFIASVDRQVDGEQDLDKRVSILQEALDRHPGESHFERALHLNRDKRDLVNSIIARARMHEEQAAFSDALNDWEVLRTIYGQYPGLQFEMERLQKRREQQVRIQSKSQVIEQIDNCLHSSDFNRALDLLQGAVPEFPADEELRGLEKLAHDGVQRQAQAQALLAQGQELCAEKKAAEGIPVLRQAFELDENSAVSRAVLANALVEHARSLVETDWREAESLAKEASHLNPTHPTSKMLRTLIADQKRETSVTECVAQARNLQAAADLAGAMARIEEGLSNYPREPRLVQIQESVQRDLQTLRRQTRRRDLDELRRISGEAESSNEVLVKLALGERTRHLAKKYSDDGEIVAIANNVLQRLSLSGVPVPANPIPPEEGRTLTFHTPPPLVKPVTPAGGKPSIFDSPVTPPPLFPADLPSTPAAPSLTPSFTPPRAASPWDDGPGLDPTAGISTAGLPPSNRSDVGVQNADLQHADALTLDYSAPPPVATIIGALPAADSARPSLTAAQAVPASSARSAASPSTKPLAALTRLQTSVENLIARIPIALGELKSLNPRTILIAVTTVATVVIVLAAVLVVSKRTHRTADTAPTPAPSVDVAPAPVGSTPEPSLPAVRLSSDTGAGKVSFDGRPPTELQNSQWSLDKIAAGDHTLTFVGPQGDAAFSFSADATTLPRLNGPINAKGVLALLVSSTAGRMHVYSSDSAAKLSLDGQSPANIPDGGSDFTALADGPHQLAVTRGADHFQLEIEVSSTPVLTTFLESGRDVGTLLVFAGQDKAKIFLNGKPLDQLTSTYGQLRISNLEPKEYSVRVSKPGFQDTAEQKVHIRKGEQAKLIFDLPSLPHLASLSIRGGTPGATVLVDQSPVGTIQPDGSLSISSVNPGDHTVEVRKQNFKVKESKKHFVAGSAVSLVAAEAALEAAQPELRIDFAPADTQVSIGKTGETPTKVTSGAPLSLAAGSYTLTARTADGLVRTSTIDLSEGQSRTIELPAPDGMSKWDNPLAWSQEKSGYVHKGGDYVLYGVSPAAGTFVFSAQLQKGHRLQWVVHYTNANNYDLFQLDDNNFYRTSIRNGQKTADTKIPQKSDKKAFHTIQIRVEANQVVHQIKQGDNWVVLDRWAEAGSDLSSGKFGFYLPGNDQAALSTFAHYADMNAH
jgi:serine/threonine protein kinase